MTPSNATTNLQVRTKLDPQTGGFTISVFGRNGENFGQVKWLNQQGYFLKAKDIDFISAEFADALSASIRAIHGR